jgi:hypothetical protein
VFRFLRFFQREFGPHELAVPTALAQALGNDAQLRADYQKVLDFYARLTNPYACLSVADLTGLAGGVPPDPATFTSLCRAKGVRHIAVSVLPYSDSPEAALFEKLFPEGLPPGADLMRELIRRVRSGEVNLNPGPNSGWYDYQLHALEVFVLPERGEGANKLLLTRAYKERALEAFQALVTRRRETHVRQVGPAIGCSDQGPTDPPDPPGSVRPRLRVEPCPGYFLRTARSYRFLANFLESAVGADGLRALHGLRAGGPRKDDLWTELRFMRDLFYGLYLVSAEDVGHGPALAAGEAVDEGRCYAVAEGWLKAAFDDPDLAADVRVTVPVYVDLARGRTRMWATVGVRMAKLEASYAGPDRPPRIRPKSGDGEWRKVEPHRLVAARYRVPGSRSTPPRHSHARSSARFATGRRPSPGSSRPSKGADRRRLAGPCRIDDPEIDHAPSASLLRVVCGERPSHLRPVPAEGARRAGRTLRRKPRVPRAHAADSIHPPPRTTSPSYSTTAWPGVTACCGSWNRTVNSSSPLTVASAGCGGEL